jgi:hypothetical protein
MGHDKGNELGVVQGMVLTQAHSFVSVSKCKIRTVETFSLWELGVSRNVSIFQSRFENQNLVKLNPF